MLTKIMQSTKEIPEQFAFSGKEAIWDTLFGYMTAEMPSDLIWSNVVNKTMTEKDVQAAVAKFDAAGDNDGMLDKSEFLACHEPVMSTFNPNSTELTYSDDPAADREYEMQQQKVEMFKKMFGEDYMLYMDRYFVEEPSDFEAAEVEFAENAAADEAAASAAEVACADEQCLAS
eukprot:tig00000343_g24275.t1